MSRPNGCNNAGPGQGRRPGGDPPRRNLDQSPDQDRHYNNDNYFVPEEQEFYGSTNNYNTQFNQDQEFHPQHGFGVGSDAWLSNATDLRSFRDPSDYAEETNENVLNWFNYMPVPFEGHEVEPPQEMEIPNQEQQLNPVVEQQGPAQPLLESLLPAKDVEGLNRLEIHLRDTSNMKEAVLRVSKVVAKECPVGEATGKVLELVLEPGAVSANKLTWDVVRRNFKTYSHVLRLIVDAVQNMVPEGTIPEVKDAIKHWLSSAQVRNVAG